MEDALVPTNLGTKKSSIYSLNPCFNGRCTSTDATATTFEHDTIRS